MNVEKKVIANLEKCYAISELTYKGEHCFLVSAEKQGPCYVFSEEGKILETVWNEPGGVMTMTPVPGADGQFLATHRFYSPNDLPPRTERATGAFGRSAKRRLSIGLAFCGAAA